MKFAPKVVLWAVLGVVVVALVVFNRSRQHHDAAHEQAKRLEVGEYTVGNLMDIGQAAETARRFVSLWSTPEPGDTTETWEERINPLVTDGIGKGLLATDLRSLPRLALSPATVPDVQAVSTSQATIVVTLEDGSQIAVEVIPYGPGYAVSDFNGLGGE